MNTTSSPTAIATVKGDALHPNLCGQVYFRNVVIHSMPDDFISQPAGNAGMKIACGIIEKTNSCKY